MTLAELNRLCEDAYTVMDDLVEGMAAVYEDVFAKAGKRAVRAFKSATITAAAWTPPLENTLPTSMTEEEQERVDRQRRLAAQAIAAIFASLGLALLTREFLEAISKRGADNFELEILRQLRSVTADSFEKGLTAEETAVRIREAFGNVGPTVAQMLAETELTAIANERSMAAAAQTASEKKKPVFKVWHTMLDNRVRPAHASAEGQTQPLDAPFSIGGFSLMYPGDPAGPMRLVARCRCRLSYTNSMTASAKEATVQTMKPELATTSMSAGVTITINDEEPITTVEAAAAPAPWKALLAIEGQQTEDRRIIDVGALSWRDLPLSLMAMDETGPGGHEGAQVAGRIDTVWREGSEIWATGVFSETEFGQHIQALVGEQSLRGNSVDLAVTAYEYRTEDGEVLEGDALMDAFFDDVPIVFAVTDGVIMASTVCSTPAIAGAEIMLASGVMTMRFSFENPQATLTAGAAGMVPLHPPQAWFDHPALEAPTPLTVTPEGRVYGHAALWNSCHIGEPSGPGVCVPPPRSEMSYEIFHHGAVTTEEGVDIPCGQITLGTTHAGRDLSWSQTIEHYENSGVAVADVCAGEDEWGIYLAGALRPDVPAEKVREMKAGSISGDWRSVINRGLEFVGALIVNIPGFPVPRPSAVVTASAAGEEVVLALVAAGMVDAPDEVEGMGRREYLRKIAVLTR